jgi:hypothetical protein
MDVDQDNIIPNHALSTQVSTSAASLWATTDSGHMSMQLDLPFDGGQVADSNYRGESEVLSHLVLTLCIDTST